MKSKSFRLCLLVLVTGALAVACVPGGIGIGPKGPPGSLTVTISDKNIKPHTITPLPANYTVGSYSLSFTGPAGETFAASLIPDSSGAASNTYSNLAYGAWKIKVDALNQASSHDVIGHGDGTGVVNVLAAVVVPIQVNPISGTGTLTITVDFAGTVLADPKIDASLTPESGQTNNVTLGSFSRSGSLLTSLSALDNGYYKLTGKLLDGATQQGLPITEVVWILAGQTSSANYLFSGGSLSVNITSNLLSALTVALAQTGTTLTASVTNPNPPPANLLYEWDVDGSVAAGETSASYDYGALPPGAHSITAIVYTAGWAQAGDAVANVVVSPAPASPDFAGTWTTGNGVTITLGSAVFSSSFRSSDGVYWENTEWTMLSYDTTLKHIKAQVATESNSGNLNMPWAVNDVIWILYRFTPNDPAKGGEDSLKLEFAKNAADYPTAITDTSSTITLTRVP